MKLLVLELKYCPWVSDPTHDTEWLERRNGK